MGLRPRSMKSQIRIDDNVRVVLSGPDGRWVWRSAHNLVMVTAREAIAERLLDLPGEIAIGSGLGSVDETDTALERETGRAQLASKKRVDSTVSLVAEILEGAGRVSEAGLFNGNDMLARVRFDPIAKRHIDIVRVTWQLPVE